MDAITLTSHLDHEYGLLTTALAAADPKATVPTCPDWTAADLEAHVAKVYLHKATTMALGHSPDPWPPPEGVGSLADTYAALTAAFAIRQPAGYAETWFDPDQTVGFWIRRMAQETAIHRVDAELAAGRKVTTIAPDLAVDGIDELMHTVVAFASASWPEDFVEVLPGADPRPVLVTAGGRGWTVTAAPEHLLIADADPDLIAAATVSGAPGEVFRWLWNRGGEVSIAGDDALGRQLLVVMGPAMQ